MSEEPKGPLRVAVGRIVRDSAGKAVVVSIVRDHRLTQPHTTTERNGSR